MSKLYIERIRTKRQHNVEEQNAIIEYEIEQCVVGFRTHKALPKALLDFFESKGIDLDKDILVQNDRILEQGSVNVYVGLWITSAHHFISYTVFLDDKNVRIDDVDEWEDVTDQIKISAHAKGRSATYGQLCINVLNKVNAQNTLK